ncbi:hypothetical protein MC885_013023, partial [Smutsia gigantea]
MMALGCRPNNGPQTSAEAMLAVPPKRRRRECSSPACEDPHPQAQGGSNSPEQDGVLKGLSLETTQGQWAVLKPEVWADVTRGGPEVFQQKRPEPGEGSALASSRGLRVRDVRRCRGLSCPRAAKEPRASMKIEHLNATFQPAQIGHTHGLQVTYLKDNSTRNMFVCQEDGK